MHLLNSLRMRYDNMGFILWQMSLIYFAIYCRQIHPISEKTEVKCTLTNLNQGSPQRSTNTKTMATLPGKNGADGQSLSPRHRGIQKKDIGSPAAFIHVNSGRIELVSKESSPSPMTGVGVGLWKGAGASVSPRGSEIGRASCRERV